MDPTAAQTNIAKFNIFATQTTLVQDTLQSQQMLAAMHGRSSPRSPGSNLPSFAETYAALTQFSVAN